MCRLREAALSEANSWHVIQLPDYAQLECVNRGNKVLRKMTIVYWMLTKLTVLCATTLTLIKDTKRLRNGGPVLLRWIIF